MLQWSASFIIAAYVIYSISRGDVARLLWIVGVAPNPATLQTQ